MVASATSLVDSLCSALAGAPEDLAVAGAAAVAGGGAVLGARPASGEPLVVVGPPTAPSTAADHASQARVLDLLRELRPGDPARGEEAGGTASAGESGRLWIVDPLDGTKEFIQGIEEFCVMVGLAVDGEARLGAVYDPSRDRLFLGLAEGGAWSIDGVAAGRPVAPHPLRVAAPRGDTVRLVQSRSHPDPRLTALAGALSREGLAVLVRVSGSAGLKCMLVASGEADLYAHPVPFLREWDTCAGEAVARGAGAHVTDCAGAPLRYGKDDPHQPHGLLAAAPAVWERALSAMTAVTA